MNHSPFRAPLVASAVIALLGGGFGATGAVAADAEWAGFVENASFYRQRTGLSKSRNTLQMEMGKEIGQVGAFRRVFIGGTFRGTYDAVYDLNDNDFGDDAGGALTFESTFLPGGGNTLWGQSPVSTGAFGFGFDTNNNPNEGMKLLGSELHGPDGGVGLGVPVRPCDKDSRGCIDGYLDFDENDLRYPEFNSRLDFLRELYVDAILPQDDGSEWAFRLGRQQVVWGRTDLFRVLDVLNPVDFSRHNIYDELEDIRIPMWMLTAEKRWGPTGVFGDLNFQVVWNFDKFRPHSLGQGGTPYAILQAGDFFRAMNNCWDNGCTVSNFAFGNLATDFPRHTIGIRKANLPSWSLDNGQLGLKLEGTYESVGFSLNYLHYRSQLPSLRGGIPARNPFIADNVTGPGGEVGGQELPRDYLIAFDIDFPRINLYGGSLDFYVDAIKSVFRVEAAYTSGEEFANTLEPRLFSESDVARWVVGWDRPTFIPFLNKRRAFLISAQLFGQHLLDHEQKTLTDPSGNTFKVGMPDHEDNYIMTLLLKGWYKADTISPQIIVAHDFEGQATTVAPSVDWLISNNWRLVAGANFKFANQVDDFDDCRQCNPFPPFTGPVGAEGDLGVRAASGAMAASGIEPLGRFTSGPIGMARDEDEFQVTLRYRF
ncbi:MAG: DUF1302 family protein [Gammaproteobacteria bacterium]|nr:DUF1302 family protein [Gammaproteobacteria bacterium]